MNSDRYLNFLDNFFVIHCFSVRKFYNCTSCKLEEQILRLLFVVGGLGV